MSRVVVITGNRKGLGLQLTHHFLALGDVVVGCSRRATKLEHDNYRHFELDVADERAVTKMIRAIKKEFGKIDVLLNNAGIAAMNHTLTTPYNTAQSVMATNFMGTFLFTREVSKLMLKCKRGKIVNYSTVATPIRLEGEAVYAASKAAIENFTQITAKELGEHGITVNAVGPTPVPTDLIRNVPEDKINLLLNHQAIKRLGEFEDVLNVIEFFIDPKSAFVTGQIIYLGGVCG
jgi:3-oxoacyl-[acyl-carrier protein] reductase